jgi:AP-4 complex subunit mu-1
MPGVFGGELRMSSAAANRSVINRVFDKSSPGAPPAEQKSEIFVDIIERLTVRSISAGLSGYARRPHGRALTAGAHWQRSHPLLQMTFNGAGYMMTSEIDGAIQCKSFLAGNPQVSHRSPNNSFFFWPAELTRPMQIRLALNENLVIGGIKDAGPAYESSTEAVLLDDCSFHERVAVDNFESDRTLLLSPPAGEFIVMNYRCAAPFRPPFRVTPQVTEPAPNKLDVVISLSSEFAAAKAAVGVVLRCPLPKCTSHVSLSVRGEAQCPQKAEYDEARHELVWTFKKLPGAQEHVVRCRCTLTQERVSAIKKEVGPVSLVFTLPNFNVSRLAVRFLQILAKPRSPNEPLPQRWVRYVTQSSSYVCRL